MRCDAITITASDGPYTASQHRQDSHGPQDRFYRAESIETGPKGDGVRNIIQRRADRMQFPNDIQRQRFVEKCLILAKGA